MNSSDELLQWLPLTWDTISLGRCTTMLRALAKYVKPYNAGMHHQLLHFDDEIQTMSLQYSWAFLRKWVTRSIKGLQTKTYDLAHIPPSIMFALLAKDLGARNTVAIAAATKL